MKCESKSELMLRCFEEAEKTVDENNTDWLKPIGILNKHLPELSLQKFICSGYSNQDKWPEVKELIYRNATVPREYFFIHWMNEEWRSRGIDKNVIRYNSVLGKLLSDYGLHTKPSSSTEILRNDLLHLFQYYFH